MMLEYHHIYNIINIISLVKLKKIVHLKNIANRTHYKLILFRGWDQKNKLHLKKN